MKKTRQSNEVLENRITINTMELQDLLGCGKTTAIRIGLDAGARVNIGPNRVLWNAKKIQRYIDSVTGKEQEGIV